MEKILVTLDGSELSEAVLPYALAIAKGFDSKLTLMTSVDVPGSSFFEFDEYGSSLGDWGSVEELEQVAAQGARNYLDGQANRLKDLGFETDTRIDHGLAADTIIDYVESRMPNLVAMSTHGRTGFGRILLGSVASRVLRHSKIPLLVVRPREEMTDAVANLTDIVVPLDASELSEAVLPVAVNIAKNLNLNITLVCAVPTASQLYLGTEFVSHTSDALERVETGVREYLETKAKRLDEEDGLNVDWEILHGDPGNAIVDYARDQFENNLIAMSTHGRSGFRRWLLGSVTDKVVRSSGDPVIVVRPDRP